MAATDTAGTAAFLPALCGPRTYSTSISAGQNLLTITITPPTSPADPYTASWSLNCNSNDMIDVGVWTITLHAQLDLYPSVQATSQFVLTVLHPCLFTNIVPSTIQDMTISIYDSSSTDQYF